MQAKLFFFFTICYLAIFNFTHAQKRGISYGYHSPQDLAVLQPEISWWYNWSVEPEATVANVYETYGFDFVPMAWNGDFNETKLRAFLSAHSNTKYLLAFNEPNFRDQANMTPSQAAAVWPKLEAIARDFNLKIVGPAVNYCGNCVTENGVTYYDPFKYLDDFFAACKNCKVDYIAVHCYMNSVSALAWFIGEFERYGKPIWLTEFAGWEQNGNITKLNDQINYMIGAVDYLEWNPRVYRYAWFIGRGSGASVYPYIDLLGANGTLTELGKAYKQMPVHKATTVIDIPATIEAENYNAMSGIFLEKTSDISGFANVGYIDSGDWLEYRVRTSKDASFLMTFRIAATKDASFEVWINGIRAFTQTISNTGGWQIWQNFTNRLQLHAGTHSIRLKAITEGFNLNWFKLELPTLADKTAIVTQLKISPNPCNGILKITSSLDIKKIRIYDIVGRRVMEMPYNKTINLSGLNDGVYFVEAFAAEGRYTSKVVLLKRGF
jgi:hypothetical protein